MAMSTERVRELRQFIHAQVTSEETQEKIKACVARASDGKVPDESSLLQVLEEQGVVEEVLGSLKLRGFPHTPERAVPTATDAQPSCQPEREGREWIAGIV